MNLLTNKNNKMNSLIINNIPETERIIKVNENNSQENIFPIPLKKSSSISRNNHNYSNNKNHSKQYNSIYKNNISNTMIQYNRNYNKKKEMFP